MNQSQGSFGFTYNPHPVGATPVLTDYSFGSSAFKVRLTELIVRNHWHSLRVALSWVLKKSKLGTRYVQLKVSKIKSGSMLMTPSTVDIGLSEDRIQKRTEYRNSIGRQYVPGCLTEQIHSLLPTPIAGNEKNGCDANNGQRINRKISQGWTIDLNDMAVNGMLPTPSASDVEGAPKRADQISQNDSGGWTRTSDTTGTKFGAKLQDVAPLLEPQKKKQSQLSPFFVMEMMGFHPQWTLLPFTKND